MFLRLFGWLWNDRGAVGADGKEIVEPGEEKKFTQAQLDAHIQERLAREKSKYSDYDDLRKKVSEFEKSQDEKQLKLLEEQKKYEEASKITLSKLAEVQGLVSKKDLEIQDMKISNSLDREINKQNAYAEETTALLKSSAVLDKDGHVRIKGRDSNGLEVLYSVEEGVKAFLTQRPHLIKAVNRNGAGTTSGTATGTATGAEGQDRSVLQQELLLAHRRGDMKKVGEITKKIRERMTQI